jgi:4-diphosphocytidyl-2-C-methyl-D-erythritol kinase
VKDALEVVAAKGETTLTVTGKAVSGGNRDNLVWKAWETLKQQYPDKVGALDIYLHKAIPMGAGLGGGSADGAFMLRLLNDYYKIGLTREELEAKALMLGSDCPFFIRNTPQFATGRGENMEPIKLVLSGYIIQVICPEVHVSTAGAFKMLEPKPAGFDLSDLTGLAVKDWKDKISNDFEGPVFKEHPGLGDIKDQLYNQGALYASMSGSGSAIYGIFPYGQKATVKTDIPFEEFVLKLP